MKQTNLASNTRNLSALIKAGFPGTSLAHIGCVVNAPMIKEIAMHIPSVHGYGQRTLPLARPGDLFVTTSVDSAYLSWLNAFDMGPKKEDVVIVQNKTDDPYLPVTSLVAMDESAKERLQGHVIVPFYSGVNVHELGNSIGVPVFGSAPNVTNGYYNKINFKEIQRESGVSTVEGDVWRKQDGLEKFEDLLSKHSTRTGKVRIRGSWGASASSNWVYNGGNFEEIAAEVSSSNESEFLVEVNEHVVLSPSLRLYFDGIGRYHVLGSGVQHLSSSEEHEGNLYTESFTGERILQFASPVIKEMLQDECQGVCSLDAIETSEGDLYLVECNARMGATTQGDDIVSTLEDTHEFAAPAHMFLNVVATGEHASFDSVADALNGVIYDGSNAQRCFFPYNTGRMQEVGSISGVYIGSSKRELDDLVKEVQSRLL